MYIIQFIDNLNFMIGTVENRKRLCWVQEHHNKRNNN